MSAVKDPDQVAALVRSFLDTEVAKKQKKLAESFEKIAEAYLPWSKPQTSDLSDTKEEKLEHASKIQAKIAKNKAFATKKGKLRLTAVHIATILILPIDDLRKGGWFSHEDFPNTMLHIRLQLMSNLVNRCKSFLIVIWCKLDSNSSQILRKPRRPLRLRISLRK